MQTVVVNAESRSYAIHIGRGILDELGDYLVRGPYSDNCLIISNSLVFPLYGVRVENSLKEYGIEPIIVDPEADADEAKHEYNIDLVDIKDVKDADCIVLAVAHDIFKQMSLDEIDSLYGDFKNNDKVLIDVKSILDRKKIEEKGYSYWRL